MHDITDTSTDTNDIMLCRKYFKASYEITEGIGSQQTDKEHSVGYIWHVFTYAY